MMDACGTYGDLVRFLLAELLFAAVLLDDGELSGVVCSKVPGNKKIIIRYANGKLQLSRPAVRQSGLLQSVPCLAI